MPRGENLRERDHAADGSKGGRAKGQNAIARREVAEARFEDLLDEAFLALAVALEPGSKESLQGAREVFDRYFGRPTQRTEHTGSVDVNVDARARLADLLAHRSDPRRAKADS